MPNKPYLSLAERDRRYGLVRQAMKERGLDALLVWGDSGKWDWYMANIHYLSQMGGNGGDELMVFPLEGNPTTILWNNNAAFIKGWLEYGSWVTDFRAREDGKYVPAAVELLKQLKLTKATIGIPALLAQDRIRFPSGIFTALRAELPQADFRDATGLIEDIRAVKSPEEIALMEGATQIGEAAIDTVAEVARAGVPENEVVAAMFHTMLSQGAEIPIMFLWNTGRPQYVARLVFARRRPLQNGDIICVEFSPRFHGYCGHLNQSFVVGDWPDKECEKQKEAALVSYRGGWNACMPGMTAGELSKAFYDALAPTGYKWGHEPGAPGGGKYGSPFFHGVGLGNEGPLGIWPIGEPQASTVIREGITLAFEPGACLPDNSRGLNMGNVVQVTRDGPRQLGKRKLEIVVCK